MDDTADIGATRALNFREAMAKEVLWRSCSALRSAIRAAIDDPKMDTAVAVKGAIGDFEAYLMETLGFVRKAGGEDDPPPSPPRDGDHN